MGWFWVFRMGSLTTRDDESKWRPLCVPPDGQRDSRDSRGSSIGLLALIFAFIIAAIVGGLYVASKSDAEAQPLMIQCVPDHNEFDFDCDAVANDIDACPDMVGTIAKSGCP